MQVALIVAGVIILGSMIGKHFFDRKQDVSKPKAQAYLLTVAENKLKLATNKYNQSRVEFGKANPVVLGVIGLILSVCFLFAADTALGVYGWIFKGLGWSESSATSFAIVPFMIVFVTAFILKLFIWDDVKSLFGNESKNTFGRRVAAVASLVIFTGIVFQLAPFASVRSELVMGRQVAQAEENLVAVEADCAVEGAVDCDARLAAAEKELASAESRLVKGKEVDETMAKIVPFAEMVTAFGPIMLIEVLAMVALPLLRLRSAEKKRDKLGLNIVIKEEKAEVSSISVIDARDDLNGEFLKQLTQ